MPLVSESPSEQMLACGQAISAAMSFSSSSSPSDDVLVRTGCWHARSGPSASVAGSVPLRASRSPQGKGPRAPAPARTSKAPYRRPARYARARTRRFLAVLKIAFREEDGQVGLPELIGIDVARDVHAFCPRPFEHIEQAFDWPHQVRHRELHVRDQNRNLRFTTDSDDLVDRRPEVAFLTANVADCSAHHDARLPRQDRSVFARLGVDARVVLETGCECRVRPPPCRRSTIARMRYTSSAVAGRLKSSPRTSMRRLP